MDDEHSRRQVGEKKDEEDGVGIMQKQLKRKEKMRQQEEDMHREEKNKEKKEDIKER